MGKIGYYIYSVSECIKITNGFKMNLANTKVLDKGPSGVNDQIIVYTLRR
jgi:hypothetical protein